MPTLAGLTYLPLRFRNDGSIDGTAPMTLAPAGVGDLVVISHGWHQDPDDAEGMYEAILSHLMAEGAETLAERTFGVVGIYWPSDQFRDDLSRETVAVLAGGGAAQSAGGADTGGDKLRTQALALASLFDVDPLQLSNLAARAAGGSAGDADKLVRLLRGAIGGDEGDSELAADHILLLDERLDGRDVVARMRRSETQQTVSGAAGTAGAVAKGASALGLFSGASATIAWILNQAAYFALKKRAGVVGIALGRLLDIADLGDVQRIHFVGHSFGGRLVTAATATMKFRRPYSLSLLQGAFSHNGFGVDIDGRGLDGVFRNVIDDDKVCGRIVITHTWNDHAVGVLYAIASRASGDIAKGLVSVTPTFGGALDLHGGLGANGAQRLKPGEGASAIFDGKASPSLSCKVNNLKCDFIRSHSDIRSAEVGRILAAAMA